MADLADMAQDSERAFEDAAQQSIKRFGGIAPFDCAGCGEPIEEKRRQLLMSAATHCADCAHVNEMRNKRQGGRS